MGFVVGYAPRGLSPQIDGMPVIQLKAVLCGTASFVVFDSFESAAKPPLVSVAIYQLESAAANSSAVYRKVAVT